MCTYKLNQTFVAVRREIKTNLLKTNTKIGEELDCLFRKTFTTLFMRRLDDSYKRIANRVCHAKSPKALFSMFIYIMHGTLAIPECESTLHHLNFRSLKQEEFEGALLHAIKKC